MVGHVVEYGTHGEASFPATIDTVALGTDRNRVS